ncbi:MAG TPA: 2-dehydro-3-deoxygalactonokinase [Burkholderiaceae bacterium]|nr:2-dehydro-3-deoxygalactonokinase [Burkholderiaceae bacterium]
MTAPHAALIALDWGSSRARAWRLDAAGAVLDARSADTGALRVPRGGFDAALAALVGDWLRVDAPPAMIACGMIGSRSGWVEAPYLRLPAGVDELAAALVSVPTSLGVALAIVPGLRSDEPDVVRGEETQAIGCGVADATLCMPGTHSKWLRVAGGRIVAFQTSFTGELFDLLGSHGSLAAAFGDAAPLDERAFDEGVADAVEDASRAPAPWLHRLFVLRARVVGAGASGASQRARLSGWLIGSELLQAHVPRQGEVLLVGDAPLARWYERALGGLAAAGIAARFRRAPPDCAATGLWRIAQARRGDLGMQV